MNIRPYQTSQFDTLADFIIRLNADPAHHIGYFGIHPADITQSLRDFSLPLTEAFYLAYAGETLVGVLGVDADTELGRAWLFGPIIDYPDWQAVADQLYAAAQPTIPAGIVEHEIFCDLANVNCQTFADRHAFPLHNETAILFFPRATLPSLLQVTTPELDPTLYDQFRALHPQLFPRTYLAAQAAIDKRSEHNRIFVMAEQGVLQGYLVGKVEAASQSGYIDYVGVAETARQRGLGKRLVTAALHWMFAEPTVQHVDLTVNTENKAALRLYASLGFEQERIMRGYRKQVSH